MKFFSTVSISLALIAIASAEPTKSVATTNGKCAVTVPASWSTELSSADSPDKKRSITVSSPKAFDSFDQLKKVAPTAYKDSKVTKDTATEFEMEGKSMNGKPDVYRAIPAGPKVFCVTEAIYQSGTVDDARALVRTLTAK